MSGTSTCRNSAWCCRDGFVGVDEHLYVVRGRCGVGVLAWRWVERGTEGMTTPTQSRQQRNYAIDIGGTHVKEVAQVAERLLPLSLHLL